MPGLILLLAVLLPFTSSKIRRNPALAWVVCLVLLVRQSVSFAQVAYNGLPTVNADPLNFHWSAVTGTGPLSREPYGLLLRSIYQSFGASHLLGCEVSQLGFSLALMLEVELIFLMGLGNHAGKLVAIYGLLPSCLLNTSVTMREPFQCLGYLLLCYGVTMLAKEGLQPLPALAIPVAMGILSQLQQGFGPLLLVIVPLCVFLAGVRRPEVLLAGVVVVGILLQGIGGEIWAMMAERSYVLQKLESGEGLMYIDGYQESVERGRSDFDVYLDLSSPLSTMKTAPLVLMSYLFAPFPWQVRSILDLYGALESALRLTVFYFAIKGLFRSSRRLPDVHHLVMLGMYFLLEIMWAAGTANWGTAFRHRVVGWGLLVILGGLGFWGDPNADNISVNRRPMSARARARMARRRKAFTSG